MKKLYFIALIFFCLVCSNLFAQKNLPVAGSVVISLNNSVNENKNVDSAYIILDKCNLTAAGIVLKKYDVTNNSIIIDDLPEGKYYADVFVKGIYMQHFTKVITVKAKPASYSFKLSKAEPYTPNEVFIPAESNDFSRTSVVLMK